ncbi:MAG: AMP-binding protein, partial [Bacteroidales bacterium]|nr:AMP-binding protein [Bacteroidales bacterium]
MMVNSGRIRYTSKNKLELSYMVGYEKSFECCCIVSTRKEFFMHTVIGMLHGASERYPERFYTTKKTDAGWTGRTFTQTDKESDEIAAALLDMEFSRETKATIIAEGRPEWITSEFGLLKAACISVPLSIKLSFEEIAFRVNHSESKGFFISSNTIQKLINAWPYIEKPPIIFYMDEEDKNFKRAVKELKLIKGETVFTWEGLLERGRRKLMTEPALISDIEPTIDEHDVVNICYTSGTTGNPKGIMLTHLNYWSNAHDGVELFQIEDATFSTLVILPLDHSFAHTVGTYASLLRGITLNFVDARGGSMNIVRNIPSNLTETNPTFLMTVPSLSGNFMKKIISGVAEKGKLIDGIFTAGAKAGIKING